MRSVNTELQKGLKSTQRERIIASVVAVANHEGYPGTNVSAVIARAGVSRPTFYDYFADRDECFLAALAEAQTALAAGVQRALEEDARAAPVYAAVGALIEFAQTQQATARFAMGEVLGAGPLALDVRDRGIEEIVAAIEYAEDAAPERAHVPDLPPATIVGAVQRVLAARLRRGVVMHAALPQEILAWLRAYERPREERRWRALAPVKVSAPRSAGAVALRAPAPLGPGRPRLTPGEVAENHRQRLLFAAAELAAKQGYTATTVAEITDAADLDRRAFYAIFADKRELFMALHEFGFQRLLALAAAAFFSGRSWPQRIWEGSKGLSEFLQRNPPLTHVGFVDAYSVGEGAVQRTEDSISAFSVFLQEGYRFEPRAATPSALALEAIVWTTFEIVYQQARARARPQLARLGAQISFIALAPFLGPSAADTAIETEIERSAGEGR